MTDHRQLLLVTPFGAVGGAERVLAGLARHLPDHGWGAEAILLEPGPVEDLLADAGCPVTVVPSGRIRELHRGVRAVAAIRRAARRTGADLVFDNMSTGHLYGGLAARSLRLPSVLWQQIIPNRDFGGPPMTHAWVDRLAARVPTSAVVVHSDLAVAGQRELTPRTPVHKVNQGIDVEAVRRHAGGGARVRAELGVGDAPLVGIVGWLQPWKGQDVFLRAAAAVAAEDGDARFVVVGGAGDAEFEQRLHGLVGELGLGDRTHLVGHQSDPWSWFDALDVVVHASWGSPFDLVVIEAMALGKAVVATNRGGTGEVVVVEGETGHLVDPGDHRATAAAVLRYLRDPAHRTALGAAARVRADRFTEAAMARDMAAVLAEVLAVP